MTTNTLVTQARLLAELAKKGSIEDVSKLVGSINHRRGELRDPVSLSVIIVTIAKAKVEFTITQRNMIVALAEKIAEAELK